MYNMYSSPIFSLFSYNSICFCTIHIDELPWAGLQCLSYIPSALNLLQCRLVPQLAQAPSTHAPKVCENNMDKVCWTKSVGQLYLCDQSVTMGRVSEGNANVESLLACISYTPFVHHRTIIWVPTKHKIITFIQWRLQHVYHSAKPLWTLEWNDLTLATLLLTFGPQSPPVYIFDIILLHYINPRISSCCFPSEPERHLDLAWAMGDYGSVIWLWYVGAVWYVICELWIWMNLTLLSHYCKLIKLLLSDKFIALGDARCLLLHHQHELVDSILTNSDCAFQNFWIILESYRHMGTWIQNINSRRKSL